MCEILSVMFPQPERFARVLPWALELERLGIAGFGWGVAWLGQGRVMGYRNPGSLSQDAPGQERLAEIQSRCFLVHLRRPSKLSTIEMADTQPFVQEDGRFALCHNGMFERHLEVRPAFETSLRGRADSEVGFRLLEEMLRHRSPEVALPVLHHRLGGQANLAYLEADGRLLLYGGHANNMFWTCGIGDWWVATTALHSADRSVFEWVFPEARQCRRVDQEVFCLGMTDAGQHSVDRSLRDACVTPSGVGEISHGDFGLRG